jgi:hypothetical protein
MRGWPHGLAGRRVNFDAFEAVSQRLAQAGEAPAGAEGVASEPQAEHHAVFGDQAVSHRFEVTVGNGERVAQAGDGDGLGRLGEDRGAHRRFEGEDQPKVSGEAHAEQADAGWAAAVVGQAAEFPNLVDDRAGAAAREQVKGAGDAHFSEGGAERGGALGAKVGAEQAWKEDGKS